MAVTYTNRKGVTYTLYKIRTIAGKERFVLAREPRGEEAEELPAGFRISESPNGVVSLARDRPLLIHPEEIAAVENAIAQLPEPGAFRVAIKPEQIDIYVKEAPPVLDIYHQLLGEGLVISGRDQAMRDLEELWANFVPAIRLVLTDREQRAFRVDELVEIDSDKTWVALVDAPDFAELIAVLGVLLTFKMATEVPLAFLAPPGPLASVGLPAASGAKAPSRRTGAAAPMVHRLKITLLGLRPPVWRRLLVPSDTRLDRLHDMIQIAFGWNDSHLHQFRVGRDIFTDPRTLEEGNDLDERRFRLADVAPLPRDRFRYDYDFGDSWEHEIQVEAVQPREPGGTYPVCVGGRRACPPDDCGGVWGYVNFVEALADPRHEDHTMMMEWWGGPFDPDAFDIDAVNQTFARMGRRAR